MENRAARLLARKKIDAANIQYLRRLDGHTVLALESGDTFTSFIPVKEFEEALADPPFWSIQKGTLVSPRYVVDIDNEGVYTMTDGTRIQGRRRSMAKHREHSREIKARLSQDQYPLTLLKKCTLLEDAPIAFCIIELVFEQGRGVDFIFRYCNKEMEVVEGLPVSEMIDRSFYDVFPNGDLKWIVPYADVALNGTRREIRDFSPEIGKNLIIRCFQPEPGYCGCFLVVDE